MTDAQAIFDVFQISKPKRVFPRWDSNSQPSVLWANKPSYLGEWQEDNCLPMVLIYKVQPCTFHLLVKFTRRARCLLLELDSQQQQIAAVWREAGAYVI